MTIFDWLFGTKYKVENENLKLELSKLQSEVKTLKINEISLQKEINNFENIIKDKDDMIEELKSLINNTDINEPEKLDDINYADLHNLLKTYCKDIHLSDRIYSLTSVSEAKKFSAETKVMTRKWLREEHDCDEFSFALMGYWNDGLKQFAFGIAWSKKHAFNIMVDNKKQVWIVEPQTNKFTKIEDTKDNNMYYPLDIIII